MKIWLCGKHTSFFVACLSLLTLSLSGCSKNPYATVRVSGKVFCDGKPAHGGTIVFRPVDAPAKTGRPAGAPGLVSTAVVGSDGSFSLATVAAGVESSKTGALIGPHEVYFELPRSEPWEIADEDKGLPPADLEKMKAELAKRPVYPALACSPNLNPSTVEVKASGNSFEFKLLPMSEDQNRPARRRGSGGGVGEHNKIGPGDQSDPSAKVKETTTQ